MGWTAYGELALRQLKYAEAERRYRIALSLQPEAIQIHKKIGNLMVITGRLAEAKSAYMRIEELQGGNDPLNAYDLAKVGAMSGDTGEATHWLDQALKRGYSDFAGIMTDEELTPVFSDGRFAELANRYFPKQH
jgi:Flp pilus assembly protein TadD